MLMPIATPMTPNPSQSPNKAEKIRLPVIGTMRLCQFRNGALYDRKKDLLCLEKYP